ncbi:MAG: hypothetical protein WDW38_003499 [Sanguina aurantia]
MQHGDSIHEDIHYDNSSRSSSDSPERSTSSSSSVTLLADSFDYPPSSPVSPSNTIPQPAMPSDTASACPATAAPDTASPRVVGPPKHETCTTASSAADTQTASLPAATLQPVTDTRQSLGHTMGPSPARISTSAPPSATSALSAAVAASAPVVSLPGTVLPAVMGQDWESAASPELLLAMLRARAKMIDSMLSSRAPDMWQRPGRSTQDAPASSMAGRGLAAGGGPVAAAAAAGNLKGQGGEAMARGSSGGAASLEGVMKGVLTAYPTVAADVACLAASRPPSFNGSRGREGNNTLGGREGPGADSVSNTGRAQAPNPPPAPPSVPLPSRDLYKELPPRSKTPPVSARPGSLSARSNPSLGPPSSTLPDAPHHHPVPHSPNQDTAAQTMRRARPCSAPHRGRARSTGRANDGSGGVSRGTAAEDIHRSRIAKLPSSPSSGGGDGGGGGGGDSGSGRERLLPPEQLHQHLQGGAGKSAPRPASAPAQGRQNPPQQEQQQRQQQQQQQQQQPPPVWLVQPPCHHAAQLLRTCVVAAANGHSIVRAPYGGSDFGSAYTATSHQSRPHSVTAAAVNPAASPGWPHAAPRLTQLPTPSAAAAAHPQQQSASAALTQNLDDRTILRSRPRSASAHTPTASSRRTSSPSPPPGARPSPHVGAPTSGSSCSSHPSTWNGQTPARAAAATGWGVAGAPGTAVAGAAAGRSGSAGRGQRPSSARLAWGVGLPGFDARLQATLQRRRARVEVLSRNRSDAAAAVEREQQQRRFQAKVVAPDLYSTSPKGSVRRRTVTDLQTWERRREGKLAAARVEAEVAAAMQEVQGLTLHPLLNANCHRLASRRRRKPHTPSQQLAAPACQHVPSLSPGTQPPATHPVPNSRTAHQPSWRLHTDPETPLTAAHQPSWRLHTDPETPSQQHTSPAGGYTQILRPPSQQHTSPAGGYTQILRPPSQQHTSPAAGSGCAQAAIRAAPLGSDAPHAHTCSDESRVVTPSERQQHQCAPPQAAVVSPAQQRQLEQQRQESEAGFESSSLVLPDGYRGSSNHVAGLMAPALSAAVYEAVQARRATQAALSSVKMQLHERQPPCAEGKVFAFPAPSHAPNQGGVEDVKGHGRVGQVEEAELEQVVDRLCGLAKELRLGKASEEQQAGYRHQYTMGSGGAMRGVSVNTRAAQPARPGKLSTPSQSDPSERTPSLHAKLSLDASAHPDAVPEAPSPASTGRARPSPTQSPHTHTHREPAQGHSPTPCPQSSCPSPSRRTSYASATPAGPRASPPTQASLCSPPTPPPPPTLLTPFSPIASSNIVVVVVDGGISQHDSKATGVHSSTTSSTANPTDTVPTTTTSSSNGNSSSSGQITTGGGHDGMVRHESLNTPAAASPPAPASHSHAHAHLSSSSGGSGGSSSGSSSGTPIRCTSPRLSPPYPRPNSPVPIPTLLPNRPPGLRSVSSRTTHVSPQRSPDPGVLGSDVPTEDLSLQSLVTRSSGGGAHPRSATPLTHQSSSSTGQAAAPATHPTPVRPKGSVTFSRPSPVTPGPPDTEPEATPPPAAQCGGVTAGGEAPGSPAEAEGSPRPPPRPLARSAGEGLPRAPPLVQSPGKVQSPVRHFNGSRARAGWSAVSSTDPGARRQLLDIPDAGPATSSAASAGTAAAAAAAGHALFTPTAAGAGAAGAAASVATGHGTAEALFRVDSGSTMSGHGVSCPPPLPPPTVANPRNRTYTSLAASGLPLTTAAPLPPPHTGGGGGQESAAAQGDSRRPGRGFTPQTARPALPLLPVLSQSAPHRPTPGADPMSRSVPHPHSPAPHPHSAAAHPHSAANNPLEAMMRPYELEEARRRGVCYSPLLALGTSAKGGAPGAQDVAERGEAGAAAPSASTSFSSPPGSPATKQEAAVHPQCHPRNRSQQPSAPSSPTHSPRSTPAFGTDSLRLAHAAQPWVGVNTGMTQTAVAAASSAHASVQHTFIGDGAPELARPGPSSSLLTGQGPVQEQAVEAAASDAPAADASISF